MSPFCVDDCDPGQGDESPPTWEPTVANIRLAAAVPMRYPNVLIRTFSYALDYLSCERLDDPADDAALDADTAEMTALLYEIVACLHGLHPRRDHVSREQLEDAHMWMLNQCSDPLGDTPFGHGEPP